jgi:hypothetical protein
MSALAIALITRLSGLFGLKLSEFWAGAIAAALLAAGLGLYSWRLYDAGYASAEGKCEAAALQSQIDALQADRDNAMAAARDAALRLASIEKQAHDNDERTAAYVAELEARKQDGKPNACALTCDDLRGMRIVSKACPAGPRPAAGAGAVFPGRRAGGGSQ